MKIISCVRIYATFAVAKRKPEKKNSGLYGIRSLDLCSLIGRALHYSIAEVKGSNPVQIGIFFRLSFPNCKSCVYNCDDHPSFKCFRFCCCCCLVLFCFVLFFFFLWNRNVLGFHVMKEREPNCKTPHRNFNSLSDETHGRSELTVHKQSRGYKRNKKKEGRKIYKNDSFNIWQSK